MAEYKYLSQCTDYAKLLKYCTKEQLEYIESEITEYEEQADTMEVDDYSGYGDIIGWYEGLITTDDLIEFIKDIWD